MRVIIAGSRGITDIKIIAEAVAESEFKITSVVSGTARGVDKLGEEWAKTNGIDLIQYPANWNKYGKLAGYRRNVEMASDCDALIAIWDGESNSNTAHIIDTAEQYGLEVFVYEYEKK